MKALTILVAVTVLSCTAIRAYAEDVDPWVLRVGVHTVDPKSNNGTLASGALKADVGSDTKPTIALEYMLTHEWGIDVLAAIPFEHDINLNGARAGTTKQLPPTVSVQYHFNSSGKVSPFVGLGLNYTLFFSEHPTGPLAGTRLSLGDSLGPAAHVGIDFQLSPRWLFTVDARWIKIGTDVKVNGTKVGSVDIDPFVYGVAVGYRF